MGIVAGTVVGGAVGLILGHLAIGAGIGCAAGLIIGAAAQALRSRRQVAAAARLNRLRCSAEVLITSRPKRR